MEPDFQDRFGRTLLQPFTFSIPNIHRHETNCRETARNLSEMTPPFNETGMTSRANPAATAVLFDQPFRHVESAALVAASADRVFARLDEHENLSSHMNKPSWRMGGGHMTTTLDSGRGQSVGSRIHVSGRVFGLNLSLVEEVTFRVPPHRKVWETVGSPSLIVIGPYRMGFEVTPGENGSMLRVFIDYTLPALLPSRWLGRLLGGFYARWCTRKMVGDAARYFAPP